MTSDKYGSDYFLKGEETGLSNYSNYTWLPDRTIPMAMVFIDKIMQGRRGSVLEIGCARGFFVKALRFLEVAAVGYDISEWAIQNCHPDVREYVSNTMPEGFYDWAYAKDLMEHLSTNEIRNLLLVLSNNIMDGMFFIVPVCVEDGGAYVYPNDEKDPTHVQRRTLDSWIRLFIEFLPSEFSVYGSYHVEGLKPASKEYPFSCGFFLIRRHEKITSMIIS